METTFRHLVCVLLFALGPLCFGQAVTVRIITDKKVPLQKEQVALSLLYEKGGKTPAKFDPILHSETDKEGEARFVLPDPAPAHLSVRVKLGSPYWHCGCGAFAETQEVIRDGIVDSAAKPKAFSKAKPGEILFVVRPLSFFERLLYPVMKE